MFFNLFLSIVTVSFWDQELYVKQLKDITGEPGNISDSSFVSFASKYHHFDSRNLLHSMRHGCLNFRANI